MKFITSTLTAILASLSLASAETATTTGFTVPKSTDASSYFHEIFPTTAQPTWATGKYYTTLASALYSVDKSFIERDDYQTIVNAIWSAASEAGDDVYASVSASQWNWGDITTNTWYQSRVPDTLQTAVVEYNEAFVSVETSVMAVVTETSKAGGAAAMPRCTGMAVAGVAAGVAIGVAGLM